MERIRVASLQYYIRPVQSFDQFRDQVVGLVDTAVDYKCRLVVFPEYFTLACSSSRCTTSSGRSWSRSANSPASNRG